MFEISVKTHFSAAHRLPGYAGNCANIHGHNWNIEVYVRGSQLNNSGMLIDFRELRRQVADQISTLDHTDLNTLPAFKDTPPTSEHIAHYLYQALAAHIDNERYHVHRVTVWETQNAASSYIAGDEPSPNRR